MITHDPFILENGYELAYHEIWEKDIDFYNGIYTISIGSWASEELRNASNKPQKITDLRVKYDTWLPEYADAVEQTVMSHPEWTGSGVKPSPDHIWNPISEAWIPPAEKPLQELKDLKWAEIKRARTAQEFGGFVWDGSNFDSTPVSVQRITGAVTLAMLNTNFSIDWTLADNSVRTLNAQQMIAVGVTLGQHVNFCHEKARLLRVQIEAATTSAEVSAISW